MYDVNYDPDICVRCETLDCLTRCQYMDLDLESARRERRRILNGEDSRVLQDCVTCYACEEYCPFDNHPFYLIVDRQEEKGFWPVPIPLTKQQIIMMAPRGKITPRSYSCTIRTAAPMKLTKMTIAATPIHAAIPKNPSTAPSLLI